MIFDVDDDITWFMTWHQINRSNQRFICGIELLHGATKGGKILCAPHIFHITCFCSCYAIQIRLFSRLFLSSIIVGFFCLFKWNLSGNICHRMVRGEKKTHICRRTINQMQVYCKVAMTKPHFYMLRKVRLSVLYSQCIWICSSLLLFFLFFFFFLFSGIRCRVIVVVVFVVVVVVDIVAVVSTWRRPIEFPLGTWNFNTLKWWYYRHIDTTYSIVKSLNSRSPTITILPI